MSKPAPLTQIISALLNEGRPFPASLLHRFSDMTESDIQGIMKVWPQVSMNRRHSLLEDLENLAESDTLTSFDAIARQFLMDSDPGVRLRALHILWECSDTDLIQIYLDLMEKDEDVDCRAAAASALGSFIYKGEVEEIPEKVLHVIEGKLLAAATEAASPLVRRRALEALGASSRKEVPGLIEAAMSQRKNDWVASALFAMGRSNNERWEKVILAHLFDQEDQVRMEAVRAAGRLNLSTARFPLLDLLEDEENPELFREVVWALSSIGGEGVRTKIEELCDREEVDDDLDFFEEALENLLFTEDLNQFDLLDVDLEGEASEEDQPEP